MIVYQNSKTKIKQKKKYLIKRTLLIPHKNHCHHHHHHLFVLITNRFIFHKQSKKIVKTKKDKLEILWILWHSGIILKKIYLIRMRNLATLTVQINRILILITIKQTMNFQSLNLKDIKTWKNIEILHLRWKKLCHSQRGKGKLVRQ
jgi:hypothetical protein